MAKRRGHGEGSIYQRSRDGRWVASIDLGYVDGKRKRKRTIHRTRKEAGEALSKLRQAKREGRMVAVDGRTTVASYLDDWLETAVKTSVKPSTYKRYESLVRLHVKPQVGKKRLGSLKALDLQRLYADRLEKLSPQSVVHLHRVVHRALKQAVRWGLIPTNPAANVDPPRAPSQEMKTYSSQQAQRFLAAAQGHRLQALFVLALTTGARRGELLALRWKDVDLDAAVARVTGSLQKDLDGKPFIGEPKTKRSRRELMLNDLAVDALRRHRSLQAEERLQAGPLWADRDLVFSEPDGGFLRVSVVRRDYRRLLEDADVPKLRFHDLRHTSATLSLQQGVHPKVVSDMLGHASVAITLDTYSHVMPSMHRKAADALQAALTVG